MNDFNPDELGVYGGASAPSRWTTGSDGDDTYTGTIDISGIHAPGNRRSVVIEVPRNVAEDDAGNGNFALAANLSVTVDNQKPTPTIASVSGTKSDDFAISITFDENVSNFEASDISLATQSGTAAGTVSAVTGSDTTYTATIAPTGTGTLRISIPVDAADDDAGNTSKVSSNVDVTVDTEAPTPTITGPTTPQNGAFDVTIDFGEDVTGFVKSDITVGGTATRTVGTLSGSGASYTLGITPTTSGTVTIDVAADVATDGGGNKNNAATQKTVTVDKDAPVPVITAPTTVQNGAFDVTVDFGEDVTGFALSDLRMPGLGQKNIPSNWNSGASGPQRYTVTVTPSSGSTILVTFYVRADVAMDTANNNNVLSNYANVDIDTVRPTVTIGDVPTTDQKDAFDLTITFSEDVTGFETDDLTFTGTDGVVTATAVTAVGQSKSEYKATITPNDEKEENIKVKVRKNAVTDVAGNGNTVSAATSNIRIDTIRPTPTITGPTTPQNGAFDVTIDFGEDVTGFVKSDITVGGTATRTVGTLSGSGASYTLGITPTTSGTVTIDVAADVATDGGGNNNNAATQKTVTVDKDAPVPVITAPTTPQNGAFDVTVDFGEDVTDFAVVDLVTAGASSPQNWKSGANGPQRYTLTVTPGAGGTIVSILVSANVATDTAGNGNTESFAFVDIDTVRPTVTIGGMPTEDQKDAFDLTITFDEDVTGFAAADLTVTGQATATSVAAVGTSKKEYKAKITPNANQEGNVTVKVKANAVTDVAGNGNTVSTPTGNIRIDTIVPTVAITELPAEQNAAFDLTITFSEDVTGFAKGDLTVIGPATATSVSGSGSSWTAKITPNATSENDVTVKVKASTVIDAARNGNTAGSNTVSVHIDTIVPTVAISDVPSTDKKDPFDLTITFSEDVTGFATG